MRLDILCAHAACIQSDDSRRWFWFKTTGVEEAYDRSISRGASILLVRSRIAISLLVVMFVFLPILAKAETKQIDQTVYQDFVKQCVGPSVHKAVDSYYGEPRRIAYWQMDILDIKRLRKGSYHFEITVRVKTSKGSFMPPYGTETITLSNMTKLGDGDFRVIQFRHQNDVRRE